MPAKLLGVGKRIKDIALLILLLNMLLGFSRRAPLALATAILFAMATG